MGVITGMLFEKDKHNEPILLSGKFASLAKRVHIMVENGFDNALIRNFIDKVVSRWPEKTTLPAVEADRIPIPSSTLSEECSMTIRTSQSYYEEDAKETEKSPVSN